MAFVVLQPNAIEEWKGRENEFEKYLKDYARSRLPGFACPEWVRIVEDLPVRGRSLINEHRAEIIPKNSEHPPEKYLKRHFEALPQNCSGCVYSDWADTQHYTISTIIHDYVLELMLEVMT